MNLASLECNNLESHESAKEDNHFEETLDQLSF